MNKNFRWSLLTMAVAAVVLAGCGGGGSSDDDESATPDPEETTSAFTTSASWTFALPAAGESLCYDVDTQAEVAGCEGAAWDLRIESSGSTATLWTNSGISGSGAGGAFGGPFDHTWEELSAWLRGTTDPVNGEIPETLFFPDEASGVFSGSNGIGSAIFEYGLGGDTDHLLYPNYRVFLITTDLAQATATSTEATAVYALQVTGYYGGAGGTTSGWPSIRWIDTAAPDDVHTATYDATTDWVYIDLATGEAVDQAAAWDIAFNRYNVKLNSGISGDGSVGGYLARTPDGLYDSEGAAVADAVIAATPEGTLADLTTLALAAPATAGDWVQDSASSPLNPDYEGSYPEALDFGWYSYYPTSDAASAAGLPAVAHLIAANAGNASLLRTGEGTGYARFHVTDISYADSTNASSTQTWTIEFDVQPSE